MDYGLVAQFQYVVVPELRAKVADLQRELKRERRLRIFVTVVLFLNLLIQVYLNF